MLRQEGRLSIILCHAVFWDKRVLLCTPTQAELPARQVMATHAVHGTYRSALHTASHQTIDMQHSGAAAANMCTMCTMLVPPALLEATTSR